MFRKPALPLHHPASLLATWFGSGLFFFAPGTAGSAAALPFAVAILWLGGQIALVGAAIAVTLVGIWAADVYAHKSGVGDPGAVVIDEVAGQWLTLAAVPFDPLLAIIGFFLFRAADIVKPFPANWCDAKLKGGLGIMLDDVVAGIYAGLALWAVHRWLVPAGMIRL